MVSPKVAIVVLNYNTQNLLEKYLNYILATAYNNMDVWVVDNASTDNSVAFLESQFQEQIKILVSTENRGYAGGYNWALNQIEAEFYVLINSDVRVSKNWLKPLVNLAISNSKIGAIQPKILDDKNPEYFEYAGASGGYIDKWGYPFCRGRIFDSLEKDSGQYNETKSVFWASGACLFIRAEAFQKSSGFDDDFFAHMEEIDLCWRMQNLGYQIYVEPRSEVYHLGGGTLSEGSPFKYYLNFRNSLMLLTKNLTSSFWVLTLFWRMVLDGISAVKFLIEGKPKIVFTILKAHFKFWSTLQTTIAKRKQIQKSLNSKPKCYNKSIVWSYFVSGKKKFTDLSDAEWLGDSH
jgi:GT2 family glycosyltransferase